MEINPVARRSMSLTQNVVDPTTSDDDGAMPTTELEATKADLVATSIGTGRKSMRRSGPQRRLASSDGQRA
jgi:hypothetical protein